MEFGEAIDLFCKYLQFERRFSAHTLAAYHSDLVQFHSFLLAEESLNAVEQVMSIHVRSWLMKRMDEGLDARSANRKITALKSFYRFLIKTGVVEANPMLKVVSPKNAKKLPEYVAADRMDSLLDHQTFPDDFEGRRNKLILEMLYGTGIRRAELLNIHLGDIDFVQHQIRITGKRNKQRIIPMVESLEAAIQSYLELRNALNPQSSMLMLRSDGQEAYAALIYKVVRAQLSLVSTRKKRSPHVLRHSFATEMLNRGADLNAIKELLGHANLSATQVYTHNSIEKLKEAYRQAHPRGSGKKD